MQTWGCGNNKKRIKDEEEHLFFQNLGAINENDPVTFTCKAIMCIAFLLGRRGRKEISSLNRIDLVFDRYPHGHPLVRTIAS